MHRCVWLAAALYVLWLAAWSQAMLPFMFKGILGIPKSSKLEGIDKFASFMAALSQPLLIALAAVAPVALMLAGGALMMGNRRALLIIASTVGGLVLAAVATGLVN
jgi:hypothetical protein